MQASIGLGRCQEIHSLQLHCDKLAGDVICKFAKAFSSLDTNCAQPGSTLQDYRCLFKLQCRRIVADALASCMHVKFHEATGI